MPLGIIRDNFYLAKVRQNSEITKFLILQDSFKMRYYKNLLLEKFKQYKNSNYGHPLKYFSSREIS